MSSPDRREERIAAIEHAFYVDGGMKRPISIADAAFLLAELRAARKDAERMDWMQALGITPNCRPLRGTWAVWRWIDRDEVEVEGDTLRSVLDQAIEKWPDARTPTGGENG